MKRITFIAVMVLILIMSLGGTFVAAAPEDTSVNVVVTGQLSSSYDREDMNGATITIQYEGSLSLPPTRTGTSTGRAWSEFDGFSMTVDITGRPNGAPDIIGLTSTNDPLVGNNFPPSSYNDEMTFDSRFFYFDDWTPMHVGIIQMDFGSQSFFPGEELVLDLSFLNQLIGKSVTPGPYNRVEIGWFSRYYINDMTIYVQSNRAGIFNEIISDVEALELQGSIGDSLISKLENALASAERGNDRATVNQLNAFINEVEAQRGKSITDADASAIILKARVIISDITGEESPPGEA